MEKNLRKQIDNAKNKFITELNLIIENNTYYDKNESIVRLEKIIKKQDSIINDLSKKLENQNKKASKYALSVFLKESQLPARVYRTLSTILQYYPSINIEDISKGFYVRQRNSGIKTWVIYEIKRDEYIHEKETLNQN